jgi:hypothetical protein
MAQSRFCSQGTSRGRGTGGIGRWPSNVPRESRCQSLGRGMAMSANWSPAYRDSTGTRGGRGRAGWYRSMGFMASQPSRRTHALSRLLMIKSQSAMVRRSPHTMSMFRMAHTPWSDHSCSDTSSPHSVQPLAHQRSRGSPIAGTADCARGDQVLRYAGLQKGTKSATSPPRMHTAMPVRHACHIQPTLSRKVPL